MVSRRSVGSHTIKIGMYSYYFASASSLLNVFIFLSHIPIPIYYLKHRMVLPLTLPPILPPYYYPAISSLLFLVALFLAKRDVSWRYALAPLVVTWVLPESYRYIPPLVLIGATIYLYFHELKRLWSATFMLFSIISIPTLSLSILSLIIYGESPLFDFNIWLNLSPASIYPIITLTSFIMATISIIYIIIKRPAVPSIVGLNHSPLQKSTRNTTHNTYALAIITLSVVLSLIPHIPQVNSSWIMIGVDSPHYVQYVEAMTSRTIGQHQVSALYPFYTERSLTILLIYALSIMVGVEPAVKIFPILLSALFTTSTFILAKSLFKDEKTSAASAFFGATSFNLTAGYYSAILANWLSLSFAFLYFSLLVKYFTSTKIRPFKGHFHLRSFLYLFALLTLCWLSHAWTWDFVLLISFTYVVTLAILSRTPIAFLINNRYYIAPIIASFVLDRLKALMLGTGSAIEAGTSVSVHYLGAEYILSSFKNLIFTFQFYVGGFYSNLLIITMTWVGIYFLFRHIDHAKLLILCWVSVLSLPFFIIDLELIWRILFMLPAPLICGYLLSYLKSKTLYALAFLWQIHYVIYCLTSLF